jgi:hypothetical protein
VHDERLVDLAAALDHLGARIAVASLTVSLDTRNVTP